MRFQRVVQVDRPVAEAPLVEQFEVYTIFGGEGAPAAADHGGNHDEMQLVNQTGGDRVACEFGTANGKIAVGARF